MQINVILKHFGLNEKEVAVYMALIELGPSPVRAVAAKSKVNRGTTYDILKGLMQAGIVSYYNKESKQYFTAEPPESLLAALEHKQEELKEVEEQVREHLPLLKTLFEKQGGRPTVKLYEGLKGIRAILEDVLAAVGESKEKTYCVYSSSSVRKNVYEAMPDFTQKRIKKKIRVKTIALGAGGQLMGLDERKWMGSDANPKATYEILYADKVAHISLDDADNPMGVVIENQAIYQTQKMIFEFTWAKL